MGEKGHQFERALTIDLLLGELSVKCPMQSEGQQTCSEPRRVRHGRKCGCLATLCQRNELKLWLFSHMSQDGTLLRSLFSLLVRPVFSGAHVAFGRLVLPVEAETLTDGLPMPEGCHVFP